MGRTARVCLTVALAVAMVAGMLPGVSAQAAETATPVGGTAAAVSGPSGGGTLTVAAPITSPSATLQIGQVAPAQGSPPAGNGCSGCTLFQAQTDAGSPGYTAPVDGTITSWSVQGPSDGCAGCTVRLRIFRQTSPGTFLTVADSADQSVAAGLNTYAASIAVRAGDILGIRATNGIRWYTGNTGDQVLFVSGDPLPGALTTQSGNCTTAACWFTSPNGNGARTNVAATLRPAATTVRLGQVAPPQLAPGPGNGCTGCTLFQSQTDAASPSYSAPVDGTITSWSVQGPSDGCSGCSVRLRIFRQTAPGVFLTVGDSADQAVAPGLNTFSANLAVRAGDLLGIRATDGIRWYRGSAGDGITFISGDPAPGTATSTQCPIDAATPPCYFFPSASSGYLVNVAATLQPVGISGTARCTSGERSYTLGTATLKSGDTVVATRLELVKGAFVFAGTAPRTTYGLDYAGSVTIGDVLTPVRCSVTVTTDAYGNAAAPAGRLVPDLGNHTFLQALPLTNGVGQADFMAVPGRPNWYKIAIGPGQRLSVTVTGATGGALPVDLVLTLFGDIPARQQADQQALANNSDPLAAIQRNDAGVAPDGLSPDGLSPDGLSPDGLSPDGLSPDGLSPDGLSPDGLSPDGLSPDGLSPDGLSPDGLSPDGLSPDGLSSLYTSAQTESLLRVSDKPGTQPEAVAQNTWSATGSYYIRVRGHNGAASAADPYTVTATLVSTSCGNVTLTPSFTPTTTATAGGYRTIILTNTARLGANATALAPSDAGALRRSLATFAARPEVAGVVVDLATSGTGGAPDAGAAAAYAQWYASADSKTCPAAANIVAGTIKKLVDAYGALNPTLHYVVIAGGDAVIPYLRVPDQAGLGNESGYQPPVAPDTASDASLRFGYVLTDGFYGSITPIARYDHQLYLMDRPTGRLVESPADITAMLAAYAAGFDPATGDVIRPTSALVTGYDFLTDTAQFIRDEWIAAALAVDQDLISPAWTAADLGAKLLGPVAPTYGVVSLNGHFSANTMLAADFATRLRTTDFAAIADQRFRNLLILSSGCHSGYNIVDDQGIANVTQPLDWPQLFNGRGATLVGGTGYQYGDTDFRKYTELILSNVSQELRYGSGPVAIGEALARAKSTYLAQVATLSGTDEKALNESTLFGLPMFTVDLPAAGRIARPGTGGGVTVTPGASIGLSVASLTPGYTLTQRDRTLTSPAGPQTASYYDASYGTTQRDVQTTPGSQILPRVVLDVHADATRTARGVVLDHATFTNHGSFVALTDAAAIEGSGSRAYFSTPVATPVIPFTLNTFAGENLILTPAQFRSSTAGSPVGVERTLDTQTLRVYYSSRSDAAALAAAPVIYHVEVIGDPANATQVLVDVTVGGSVDPGVETVVATYSGDPDASTGQWQSIDLQAGADTSNDGYHFVRHYTGAVPASASGAAAVRLFIQAVGGNALVSRATNNGAYYGIPIAPPPTVTSPLATSGLTLTAPATTAYGSSFAVSARLSATDGTDIAGRTVSFTLDGPAPVAALATTDATGRAAATLRASAVPGTYTVSATFAGDGAFLGATDHRAIGIVKAPTTLAPAAAQSVTYSESAVIATLTAGSRPLALAPVHIAVGSRTILAATDARGQVRLNTTDLAAAGTASYVVTYDGDDRHLGSSAQTDVTLVAAAATVAGQSLPPRPVGSTVTFPAVVSEVPDATPGDISRALVRTDVVNDAGSVVATVTTAVLADGTTSATFTLGVAGVYHVNTTVIGGYYTSPTTFTLLTVYEGVTGGGWFPLTSGGGLSAEKKVEFGFNASYRADRLTPTGSLEFIARTNGLRFRSKTFDSLVVTDGRAELRGTGTIDRSTATWQFRLIAVDGTPDTFELSIWDASSSLAAPHYHIGPAALQGGQITVH